MDTTTKTWLAVIFLVVVGEIYGHYHPNVLRHKQEDQNETQIVPPSTPSDPSEELHVTRTLRKPATANSHSLFIVEAHTKSISYRFSCDEDFRFLYPDSSRRWCFHPQVGKTYHINMVESGTEALRLKEQPENTLFFMIEEAREL